MPTDLSLRKPKSYDYLRDAKYGFRNQMDPADFKVTNFYNFPPYCYPVTEPLRYSIVIFFLGVLNRSMQSHAKYQGEIPV